MSAIANQKIAADAFEAALVWAVKLRSGTCDPGTRAACEAWRAADAMHERAWQELQGVEDDFDAVTASSAVLASRTLEGAARERQRRAGRRKALKALGIGAVSVSAAWVAAESDAWRRLTAGFGADLATATGERRSFDLADGTQLLLNTDSAVDVRFTAGERLLQLRRGEVFVRSGSDAGNPGPRRPLRVSTHVGMLEAIGTRFGVRQHVAGVLLHVEEGAVAIAPAKDGQQVVHAGQTFLVSPGGAAQTTDATLDATAWVDGALVAKQMRLDDFVGELGRYRQGWLLCDAGVANLRVSGVFQLDDIDRALAALERALPVRIERRTRYWVRVSPA